MFDSGYKDNEEIELMKYYFDKLIKNETIKQYAEDVEKGGGQSGEFGFDDRAYRQRGNRSKSATWAK